MKVMSLSRQLALVVGAVWVVGLATGLGRDDSPADLWSHESEDIKFAARLLESVEADPLQNDENMVAGADAGDVVDPGLQQGQAMEARQPAPTLRSGGGEQSAESGDEEEGKDLSRESTSYSGDEGAASGVENPGEVAVPDANDNAPIDGQMVQAQLYNQRSTNVGNKRSSMDREQIKAAYEAGELRLKLNSIFPRGGPLYGQTKVTVRAEGLEDYVEVYPDPKCKFGGNDKIVDANYIKCTRKPLTFYEAEKGQQKNYTCIQCEDSPRYHLPEIISLSVSLTGKFDDVYSSRPFRYYTPARVDALYPRYGPKDGDTVVQVWGANFLDLGDDFRCNFGTKSTKAQFVSDSFIWCRSAQSAVVGKAMPFSVSLNRQQNTLQRLDYWYYNDPVIQKLEPDFGPVAGGTNVTLKGSGFMPFDWATDIDNRNDTFCVWDELGKVRADVISYTLAQCMVPPNTANLATLHLKLTLNNQNITEGAMFTYYNPPQIVDAGPLRGPVRGGTEVHVYGPNYDKGREVICIFGSIKTKAQVVTKSHIKCTSPPFPTARDVSLIVQYENDRFKSSQLTYTYYDAAYIDSVAPACGPVHGYTQIRVKGSGFVENNGFGKARCLFNRTYYMNATVIDSTTMYCDSPPLDLSDSESGDYFYNISVSADGEAYSNATATFSYYDQPVIDSVSPWLGPMDAQTSVNISGQGFKNPNFCNPKVRFGQRAYTPTISSDTSLQVEAAASKLPGPVVVTMSGNGQQYTPDRTLHFRDKQNTFEYYQPYLVMGVQPTVASNSGNTPLILDGILFDQFKYDNGTEKRVPIQCRFKDSQGNLLDKARKMTRISGSQQQCIAPKSALVEEKARLELSPNGVHWQDTGHDVHFYPGPRVTGVNPTYGVTKKQKNLEISGENFNCPNNDCSKIKVRFTNKAGDEIFVNGEMTAGGNVKCLTPAYPAPETLTVDVSFNGLDYSNEKVTFGYIDPFVLQVEPRLISARGTTKVSLKGYGFVRIEDSKMQAVLKNENETLMCAGQPCTKTYTVVNEKLCSVDTYPQAEVIKGSKNIGFDPINIYVMNPDQDFEPNDIDIWYYKDPIFQGISSQFAYINEHKPLILRTDFSWNEGNNAELFRKYSNITCRFTSEKTGHQVVTYAVMETNPIGAFNKGKLADQIRCRTPKWPSADTVKLEISVNGQDYLGNYQIQMVEALTNLRISPMSGPVDGNTRLTIYGTGITSSVPHDHPVFVKFGNLVDEPLLKSQVVDESYEDEVYHSDFNMHKQWLKHAEANWQPVEEGAALKKYSGARTPDVRRQVVGPDAPYWRGIGGVINVQIGEVVPINITEHNDQDGRFKETKIDNIPVVYQDSSQLEYYFYRRPTVYKLEPKSGLLQGGTPIDITGIWFDEKPEYGLFPFCRIGGNVVRAKFIQTTRIQCNAPGRTESVTDAQKVEVSLNGVDWQDTGFEFSYYQRPELTDIKPKCGSVIGGTEIWLRGAKFSKITNSMQSVLCRFTQVPNAASDAEGMDENNPPVRVMPAFFVDNETMKCASPSGWSGGDQVHVDLTFNGKDYTENKFIFSYYSYFGSFPKSGPVGVEHNMPAQFIQVRGKGFRDDMSILCMLNGTELAPIEVHPTLIKCPMYDPDGEQPLGGTAAAFATKIDGSKQPFDDFYYFEQIKIETVTPLVAPNDGEGAIYIIGRHFRDDFKNAKLGCRIGNVLASAQLLDSETIRCTLNNELPLIDEGESLRVTAALNSYSWAASDFSMHPYGITSLYPDMGPIGQNTNILVTGKGFNNELRENARCKFGTEENYLIVEAQVLDNEHLICKSPTESVVLPERADEVISVPFSIAFQEDMYYPYTNGPQKFRMYRQPVLVAVEPDEIHVGHLTEVYVYASEQAPFWQPSPAPTGESYDQYGLKCKFGRFGTAPAQFLNETTILCLTPNIQDDPADISAEIAEVTVAMNGVDFNDDQQELTVIFIGTGAAVGVWVLILGTFIFALLIIAFIFFLFGLQYMLAAYQEQREYNESAEVQPYTRLTNAGVQPAMQQRGNMARATDSAAGGGRRISRADGGSRAMGSRGLGSRALGSSQVGNRSPRMGAHVRGNQ